MPKYNCEQIKKKIRVMRVLIVLATQVIYMPMNNIYAGTYAVYDNTYAGIKISLIITFKIVIRFISMKLLKFKIAKTKYKR